LVPNSTLKLLHCNIIWLVNQYTLHQKEEGHLTYNKFGRIPNNQKQYANLLLFLAMISLLQMKKDVIPVSIKTDDFYAAIVSMKRWSHMC